VDEWQRAEWVVLLANPVARSAHDSPLASRHLCVHGVLDFEGDPAGLFVLANDRPYLEDKHLYFMEILTPYLHAAFNATVPGDPRLVERAGAAANSLTARQLTVLRCLQEGKSNGEIAAVLDISPLTVKNHVQTLLRKLNAQNRAQAVGVGIAQQLIQPRGGYGERLPPAVFDGNQPPNRLPGNKAH
jgi:DNA-binding CsgD family transcriptional regulator